MEIAFFLLVHLVFLERMVARRYIVGIENFEKEFEGLRKRRERRDIERERERE